MRTDDRLDPNDTRQLRRLSQQGHRHGRLQIGAPHVPHQYAVTRQEPRYRVDVPSHVDRHIHRRQPIARIHRPNWRQRTRRTLLERGQSRLRVYRPCLRPTIRQIRLWRVQPIPWRSDRIIARGCPRLGRFQQRSQLRVQVRVLRSTILVNRRRLLAAIVPIRIGPGDQYHRPENAQNEDRPKPRDESVGHSIF